MKRKLVMICGLLLLAAGALQAGEDGGNNSQGSQGGQNGQAGPGGQARQRMGDKGREFMEENFPGATEEVTRHREALKAIMEKVKEYLKGVRDTVKAAEGEDAKKTALETIKTEIAKYATEIVDENISHTEKMLALRKANKDKSVEAITHAILSRCGNRGGENGGENRGKMMRNRGGECGEGNGRPCKGGDNSSGGDREGGDNPPPPPPPASSDDKGGKDGDSAWWDTNLRDE